MSRPPSPLRPSIGSVEHARREREVNLSRGYLPHEASMLPDEIERFNPRYVVGLLGSGELRVAILPSKVVQLR